MKKSSKLYPVFLALILALLLAACGGNNDVVNNNNEVDEPTPTVAVTDDDEEDMDDEEMDPSIVEIAIADGNFTTLVTALEAAGLVDTLQGDGPFTVFAPTDEAFAALPEGTLEALLADPAALEDVLLYHVVAGEVLAADVVELDSATTVNGEDVQIMVDGDAVMVNEAQVVTTDIMASNGVIHVIDSVLIPPSMAAEEPGDIVEVASEAGQFETLLAAAEAAGLVETLQSEGPFTVFAPNDDAFAALPEGTIEALLANPEALQSILLYHVVEGEVLAADVVALDSATTANGEDVEIMVDGDTVMVNDAQVIATDIAAANGVIHVIDSVLIPPSIAEAATGDIVEVASAAGQFETLLAAAEAAGLVETLQSEGPFTVFAPTDDAFAALPEGTVEALLADPEMLSEILLYHVVPAEVTAADAAELNGAITASGAPVAISSSDGEVMINGATVVAADIAASNGVIHVIDSVLLPPEGDVVQVAMSDETFSTLVTAVDAAGLVETLQGEGPFTIFAPTDDAFAALPAGALDGLLADTDALTNVLLYHVIEGAVYAGDVVDLESAMTIAGEEVTITVDEDGNVFINDAQVILTNILATNGVIHVIDAVLLPPEG